VHGRGRGQVVVAGSLYLVGEARRLLSGGQLGAVRRGP
jgi:hypothetical protein